MAEPEPNMSKLADLRNEKTFPVFADCPEREVNLDFYDVIDDKFLKPKYHWCLLAEIVDIKCSSWPTELIIRDKAGVELPVFVFIRSKLFDVDTKPEYRSRRKHHFSVGHCLAILYPHRQDFRGGVVGIGLEIEGLVKVIPCSMVELLALNDRALAQDMKEYGERACHACGKREQTLMMCGRCNLCWYCDGICQRVGWELKGHRDDCKILKDKDIQAMFALDWDLYDSSLDFPLPV